MSCESAHFRFVSGERRYMQLRGRGLTSTEIAKRLGFYPPTTEDEALAHEEAAAKDAAVDEEFANRPDDFRWKPRRIRTHTSETTPTPKDIVMPTTHDVEPTTEPVAHVEQAPQPLPALVEPDPVPVEAGETTAPAVPKQPRQKKLTTRQAPPAAAALSASDIRAWAKHVGLDCPARGRVPLAIVKAYDDAHPTPAATPAAAQPLAERSQDADPQEDAGEEPTIEEEAPAEGTPAAEAEEMGHPPLEPAEFAEAMTGARARAELEQLNDDADNEPDPPAAPTHETDTPAAVYVERMLSLAFAKIGTRLAAASIDPDGTARIELIERVTELTPTAHWWNHTRDIPMTHTAVVDAYDDLTIAYLPDDETEQDERIVAWEQIAQHPFFAKCYDSETPLIVAFLQQLDRHHTAPDSPAPTTDSRPEWADVTIPEDIERARRWAIHWESTARHLEEDNAQLQRALDTVVTRWWGQVEENNRLQLALTVEKAANAAVVAGAGALVRGKLRQASEYRRRVRGSRR
ncbi:Lsr2 family protein [Microbacterium allomyrinae]|uniref:Lsr2 family protein n=1 Tax=Microbacterium allomyrinae TaxID=2830666 RepID=A0A9X1S1N3_9MICO|nr:Lsr2 family protein [Microbacterium allomyrinae]MCC2031811.1 Lsr2 family protein [Microbacterium allomyrinae]